MIEQLAPIPLDKFPDSAKRFMDPAAPQRLRTMVADGLVPMKPIIQVCCLYQFGVGEDQTPEIKGRGVNTKTTNSDIDRRRKIPTRLCAPLDVYDAQGRQ